MTFLVLNSGLLLLIYFFVKLVSILCHVTPSRDLNLVILQKSLCSNMAVTLNITYLLIPIYLKLHNGPFLIQSKKYPNVQSYSRDLRQLPMITRLASDEASDENSDKISFYQILNPKILRSMFYSDYGTLD